MNQITVTVDLTPQNLEILKQLCNPRAGMQLRTGGAQVIPFPVPANVNEEPEPEFPEPQADAVPQEAEKKPAAPKIDAKDVKAVCLKMSKAGRANELRAAFAKFGGKKFSDISEDDYPALMEELQNA